MSQKKGKAAPRKAPPKKSVPTPPAKPQEWGFEEMLTELEAIVSDAGQRLENEEA